MFYFQCDYAEGCHEAILQRLSETNLAQSVGYGLDPWCDSARARIRAACAAPDADVHFLVGGTQTNTTVIASILRPHQGALTACEGHITCHETGAIEATGHKVLPLPSADGTITAEVVEAALREHFDSSIAEHMVQPGMVYISHPTESGTLYSKEQLTELSAVCRKWGVPLYMDGARMGYGLTCPDSDLTLADIAQLCDAFYIGGTKCGALFGEAVVITNPALKKDFRYAIKQHGGMLAKGRLLGIQFDVLFENDLYMEICRSAVEYALRIRAAFEAKGVRMHCDSRTNQQFPVLTAEQMAHFDGKYAYEVWGPVGDGKTAVRFCTSWATKAEAVDALLADIASMPA